MRNVLASLFLVACSGTTPRTAADCDGLRGDKQRDECYLAVLVDVFKADAADGVAMVERISDPVSRDFAWYQVTSTVDPHSNKYCDKIKDATLGARCRTVVARPHLHRDLTGASNGKAGPGAPAPGGPGAPPPGAGPGGPPPGGAPPGSPPPADGAAPPAPDAARP
jgi:hypothetical protein